MSGTFQVLNADSAPITLTGAPPLGTASSDTVTVTANGCDDITLQPGDTCPGTVSVTPTEVSPFGVRNGTNIVVQPWSGHIVQDAVVYFPQSWLRADATALRLGVSPTATPPNPASVVLTNTTAAARTIRTCRVVGPFTISANTGRTLAPGGTLTVTAHLEPGATAGATGTLVISAAGRSSVQIALSGGFS